MEELVQKEAVLRRQLLRGKRYSAGGGAAQGKKAFLRKNLPAERFPNAAHSFIYIVTFAAEAEFADKRREIPGRTWLEAPRRYHDKAAQKKAAGRFLETVFGHRGVLSDYRRKKAELRLATAEKKNRDARDASLAITESPTFTDEFAVFLFSFSSGRDKTALKKTVDGLLETAGKKNWDGEGADPVTAQSAAVAKKLIDSFPPFLPEPDISATPHGEIDFEWLMRDEARAIISIRSEEVVYAGMFKNLQLRGTETWSGNKLSFLHVFLNELLER